MVAIPPGAIDQVRPPVESVSWLVCPIQASGKPVIAAGAAFTVTVLYWSAPQPVEYVIIEVPNATPETRPTVPGTVAIVVAPLLHAPPATPSVSKLVDERHIWGLPLIAVGVLLFIVSTHVDTQPVEGAV